MIQTPLKFFNFLNNQNLHQVIFSHAQILIHTNNFGNLFFLVFTTFTITLSNKLLSDVHSEKNFLIWKPYSFPEWSSLSRTDFTILSTDRFSEVMSSQQMLEFKTLHDTFNPPLHLYIHYVVLASLEIHQSLQFC